MSGLAWIVLFTVAFMVANRLRGTKNYLVVVPVLLAAAATYLVTGNWVASFIVGALFLAGESYGWTKWLVGIPGKFSDGRQLAQEWFNTNYAHDRTGYKAGYAYILDLIVDQRKNYRAYCLLGGFLRGIWWFVPVMAAFWWFGIATQVEAVVGSVLLGIGYPLCYWLGFNVRVSDFGYLQMSEYYYGAYYGLILSMLLFA